MTPDYAIVLFDGTCGFCDATVRWLIARDRRAALRFAALQSPTGQQLLRQNGLPHDWDQSLVLIEGERASLLSTGTLRIMTYLPWPWKIAAVGLIVPRAIRDFVYRAFARRRYAVAGKVDPTTCPLPTPEERARFLDRVSA